MSRKDDIQVDIAPVGLTMHEIDEPRYTPGGLRYPSHAELGGKPSSEPWLRPTPPTVTAEGLREALTGALRRRWTMWAESGDDDPTPLATALANDPVVLAALTPSDPLDEAWREAEAALPDDSRVISLAWPSATDDEWIAIASEPNGWRHVGSGPTPAAALRALALSSKADPEEPHG